MADPPDNCQTPPHGALRLTTPRGQVDIRRWGKCDVLYRIRLTMSSSSSAQASGTYVQQLHNWLQQAGKDPHLEWDDKQEGPQNAPEWTCTVFVEGKARGTSSASRKALAHDGAAKIALEALERERYASSDE